MITAIIILLKCSPADSDVTSSDSSSSHPDTYTDCCTRSADHSEECRTSTAWNWNQTCGDGDRQTNARCVFQSTLLYWIFEQSCFCVQFDTNLIYFYLSCSYPRCDSDCNYSEAIGSQQITSQYANHTGPVWDSICCRAGRRACGCQHCTCTHSSCRE